MQLISVEKGAARKAFYSAGLGLAVLIYLTSAQPNPALVLASLVLILIGLVPFYIWATGGSYGLPIWPAFAGYTAAISAMPVLQKARPLATYSDNAIFTALGVIGGFLIVGTLVWATMTSRQPKPPFTVLMLERGSAVKSLFWCLAAGLVFQANTALDWVTFPGNSMQVVRGICSGLSYLGIFALAFFASQKLLKPGQVWLYLIMLSGLVIASITSLMLSGAVPIIALSMVGFVLGAKKVPWIVVAVIFPFLVLLHAGKYQMRELYYTTEGERKERGGLSNLPAFYSEWISCGMEEIGGLAGVVDVGPKDESAKSSIFERAGNLHMLLLVMDKTPGQVPYLNGITYEPIPMLLVPRFLAPNKGISHAGNLMLSINYGLVDEEGSRNVSIGWSLPAEAYANFGYIGVFMLSVILSAIYAEVTRLSSGVPITSFRFIAGLVVLAGVTNENSLGVFITMQFQGVVGVGLAALVLMRRQPNPYALEVEGSPHKPATSSGARPVAFRPPRAPWMPPKMRRGITAQRETEWKQAQAAEEAAKAAADAAAKPARPRQVAVPIQPYYYRSRKA